MILRDAIKKYLAVFHMFPNKKIITILTIFLLVRLMKIIFWKCCKKKRIICWKKVLTRFNKTKYNTIIAHNK